MNTFNPETSTWSSPIKPHNVYNGIPVGQLLLKVFSLWPDHIAQIDHETGRSITNRDLYLESVRVALNLRDLGLEEGDVIGTYSGDSIELTSIVVGALILGCPVSCPNPESDFQEASFTFRCTKPKLVVTDPRFYEKIKKVLEGLENGAEIFKIRRKPEGGQETSKWFQPHSKENTFKPPNIKELYSKIATFLQTSGSTGMPKSVPISHGSLLYHHQENWTSFKVMFTYSKLDYPTGWRAFIMSFLNNMTRITINRPVDAQVGVEVIRTYKVDFMIASPKVIKKIIDISGPGDLDSLKGAISAGELVSDYVLREAKFKIFNRYSLTEANFAGSLDGTLTVGLQAKIVDENGNILGPGQQGEICLKVPFPKLNGEMFQDDFLHTGDIGFFDSNSLLQIVNRKASVFKVSSRTVDPSVIERVLEEVPGVSLICAVEVPDEVHENLPVVVFTRKEGSSVTEEDLYRYAKDHLPNYMWPRGGIYCLPEMSFSSTGKLLKLAVRYKVEDLVKKNANVGQIYEKLLG